MEKYLIKINTYAYLKTSLSKGIISTKQLENYNRTRIFI